MARKKTTPKDEAEPPPVDPITPEEYQIIRADAIWAADDTGHLLSLEQRLFVRSYIIDRNPVAALQRLGHCDEPATLKRRAAQYLVSTEVQDAINHLAAQMMARLEITADKVNRRIAAVAFFDPRQVMQFDENGVQLLHSKFWTEDQIAAVQSIEMGQHGIKMKLYDGLRAAEMLGKQLGTIKDEGAEASIAASRAAAEVVIDKILDVFDRTRRREPAQLPAPVEAEPDKEPVVH